MYWEYKRAVVVTCAWVLGVHFKSDGDCVHFKLDGDLGMIGIDGLCRINGMDKFGFQIKLISFHCGSWI